VRSTDATGSRNSSAFGSVNVELTEDGAAGVAGSVILTLVTLFLSFEDSVTADRGGVSRTLESFSNSLLGNRSGKGGSVGICVGAGVRVCVRGGVGVGVGVSIGRGVRIAVGVGYGDGNGNRVGH